jgi:hypothetical protein
MKLSAILLLVLLGIIVWSTLRMSRRREDARRRREIDAVGSMDDPGRDRRAPPDDDGSNG